MNLETRLTALNKVGKVLSGRLKKLGLVTVEDLLFYFPFRYEDYSQTKKIADLEDGEEVTIKGKIEIIANKRSPRKKMIITEAIVVDETDRLKVVWFGQPFIGKTLKVGDTVYLSGKVKDDRFGMQLVGPAYEKVTPDTPSQPSPKKGGGFGSALTTTHTARIVPMYPLTAGVTQKQMRFLVSQIIDVAKVVDEWLPEELQDRADVMPLAEAIEMIHFPENAESLRYAERRLKFDELFILQLRAEMIRQNLKRSKAEKLKFKEQEIKKFVEALPFALTKGQKVAAWEILQDMEKSEPMNRLLEGDVGAGKTVVAAMALYNCALNKLQAVILAPTEILAKQHFESLCELLPEVSIGLLSRSELLANNYPLKAKSKAKKKEEFLEAIKSGQIEIIVGTHAVIQEKVLFKNLGLVVVDEQHRFGVEQRKKIKEKSGNKKTTPHFLSMTATPIPRSFALTIYGDLDVSILKEKPGGRKEIKTRLVEPKNRQKAYNFIREQIKSGRQAFVICPLIDNEQETSGKEQNSEKKSVLAEYDKLSKEIFPDLKIDYLHGKMKGTEKDEKMNKFAAGETNILIATSVVEVGVNIPNASVMMIEDAERFGLAQLHQFRGRVGRSDHQSYCFVFSDTDTDKALERLGFFEKNTDGFKLAEYDLEVRGPGEVYGRAQSGMMNLKLATMQDVEIIKLARELAKGIDFENYKILKEKVEEWEINTHLE